MDHAELQKTDKFNAQQTALERLNQIKVRFDLLLKEAETTEYLVNRSRLDHTRAVMVLLRFGNACQKYAEILQDLRAECDGAVREYESFTR